MKLISSAFISLLILCLSAFLGEKNLSFHSALFGNDSYLFYNLRVPRVLLAFFSGSALAISGMCFQSLFRNPLATPYTLGVASGASFGGALYFGLGLSLGLFGGFSFALLGAISTVLFVYWISTHRKNLSISTALLCGVAVSMCFSSLILLMQVLSKEIDAIKVLRWLMGSVNVVGIESVYSIIPFYVIGAFYLYQKRMELNLLSLGEENAHSRGVDVIKVKKGLFFITSILVAIIVSECGPIGFVGMIIPHTGRLILGADHRKLFWYSLFVGGAFLVLCDLVSRFFFSDFSLPIGVVTALIGAPFFLFHIIKSKKI